MTKITNTYHVIIGASSKNSFSKCQFWNFIQLFFGGNKGIVDFFRQHHLLASQCNCARYITLINSLVDSPLLVWNSHGIAMEEWVCSDVSDGFSW